MQALAVAPVTPQVTFVASTPPPTLVQVRVPATEVLAVAEGGKPASESG